MSAADEAAAIAAERVVLGAMMHGSESTVVDVAGQLDNGDFYRPSHRCIFEAVTDLWARDLPTGPASVLAELERRAGGEGATQAYGVEPVDLTDMVGEVPSLASVGRYVALVANAGYRRRTVEAFALAAERVERGGDAGVEAERVAKVVAGRGPAARQSGRRARVTWAVDIDPEPVTWAWTDDAEGRLPAGALSIAAGREGTGKSSFGIWLTAQITRGTLPGSFFGQPRSVLYVAVEDSWKHTLVPRMIAAGADLSLVGRFDVITDNDTEAALSLPADNGLLEAEITRHDVALTVIDPLLSAIGDGIDTHRNREVRTALDPLAGIADRTGAVLLGIAHFNKSSGTDVASLISGSGAFKDVPRSVFGFARDSSEDAAEGGGRLMSQVKNSLGRDDLPSLTYGIVTATVETALGPAYVGRLHFTGRTDRTVADVLGSGGAADPDAEADRAEAGDWLRIYLTRQGGEAAPKNIEKAGRADGFSLDQLKRAKQKAGVRSEKSGMSGPWVWRIDVTDRDRERARDEGPREARAEAGAEGSTEEREECGEQTPTPFAPFVLPSCDDLPGGTTADGHAQWQPSVIEGAAS